VDETLFTAVAEQLAENRCRARQRRRGARYLLQGLLACKCCGYALYGKPVSRSAAKGKKWRYTYYRCIGTDAYRFGGQRVCWNKQVRTDVLEEAVWNDVCALLNDPEKVTREYQRRLKGKSNPRGARRGESLPKLIQKVKRGIARLIDAYEEGLLDKKEFEPRIRSAKERLAKLESEARAEADEEAQEQDLRLVIGQLQEFAELVRSGLGKADWSTKREIIRALVKRVEVDKEEVRVVYRVSPPPFVESPNGGILPDCGRGDHPALRRPGRGVLQTPLFQNPCSQPFADQTEQHPVTHPESEKVPQLGLIQSVEELTDVHFHQPTATAPRPLPVQHLQRLVRRSPRAEAVRAVQEVVLVDGFQHHDDRPLQDLVLERRDPHRPGLAPAAFGEVHPPHRRRPVRAGLGPFQERRQVAPEVRLPVRGRLSVHARGPVFAGAQVGRVQPLQVDVVGQRSESPGRGLLRQLCYPSLFR
jgi:hypothetical protein